MTKAELIKMLQDSPAPDQTKVYVYGDFAGAQLDYSPVESVRFRNETPQHIGIMGPDNIVHTHKSGFKGLIIIPMDD